MDDSKKRSVVVNLEPLQEHQIVEVTYDGQEVYKPPETFAEHFSKILRQIDFGEALFSTSQAQRLKFAETSNESSEKEHLKQEVSEDEGDVFDEKKVPKMSKSSLSNVRQNIQNALTEVSVLYDVLQLAKDRKFLSSDLCSPNVAINSAQNNQTHILPQHSPAFLAVAKRTSFADSISLLSNFASKLKRKQAAHSKSDGEFYGKLIELRKHWKIRKTPHTLLGDLYVQSSNFHHSSVFEIVKRDNVLDVILPKDLESFNYEIYADFVMKSDIDSLLKFRRRPEVDVRSEDVEGTESEQSKEVTLKLKAAQKSFLNKEIFSQMCKEATHVKLACQCTVLDDRIICRLSPNVDMILSLVRTTNSSNAEKESVSEREPSTTVLKRSEKFRNFEKPLILFIKELYLSYLEKSSVPYAIHPVSSPIGVNPSYLSAAVRGFKKSAFDQIKSSKCVLESAVNYALHFILKSRVDSLIESLQERYPCISFVRKFQLAKNSLNLKTESSLTLSLNVKKFQYAKAAKLINIVISEQTISFTNNDSWSYATSFACLENMLLESVSEILVAIFLQVSASFSWIQLTFCGNAFSSTFGVIVQHPESLAKLKFTVYKNENLKIEFWKLKKAPLVPEDSDVVQDQALHELQGEWINIKYWRIPGSDIYDKFEHLFASFL
ncbi:mediator of RNA polymerase II transcription subunit 17-like [Convolutriloba macropyga]|uniref:mediator of RNA polymerase II transcription subunit 17-like n=1 Tax=Convolutriloba macropyga TaxID=536237 RepID=UPI003F51B3E1